MKKLTFLLLSLLLTGLIPLDAQKDLVREDFFDAEFFLAEEEYSEALYSFQKVYNAGFQNNANINYRIGVCYSNIPGQKNNAIPYLEKAVKNISENYKEGTYNEVFAPSDSWLYLGNAYRINYQLDKAIESYNKFINLPLKNNPVDIEFARQQIESCKRAKEAMKNPAPIYKENLGREYNTSLNNFQLVYSGDGNTMVYMTSQKFYDAIYFVKRINDAWTNPINITPQVESDGNQYTASLSFDGTQLYLIRIDNFDADILLSDFSMGRWNPSKSIGKTINTKFFESHASISPDGKTLYFTSNRTDGAGGMDIFLSRLTETGEWGEPVNLGKIINTPLNEESPFICNDGKTLYFSSQGHTTIGGYDIFRSVLQDDNTWSAPEALPYPMNTTDDDLYFFPQPEKNGGFLTLYDEGGYGNGDLYFMSVISPEEAAEAIQPRKEPVAEEPVPVVTPSEEKPSAEPEKPVSFRYFIKPIYFGFDSYILTDAAKDKLMELASALKEFPALRLEVRGYTDSKGPYEYNQVLSEKRAKTVADFLVANGVDKSRLKTGGFSESENVAINTFADGRDSVEGRKFNRRVEFRIEELGGALLLIEPAEIPENLKIQH